MSEHLHTLIKSLSGAEKGYFKKYCNTHSRQNDSKYLSLFSAIDKQEVYDEEKLAKRFTTQGKGNAFAVMKHYLHGMLLKSLRAFHAGRSATTRLHEHLIHIELFFRKRLYDLCLKEIEKARQVMEQHELFHFYFELAHWQRLVNGQKGYSTSVDKEMEQIHNTEIDYANRVANNSSYAWLSYQLFNRNARLGPVRKAVDLSGFEEIMADPLLTDEDAPQSSQARARFYNLHAKYHEIAGDFEQCHHYSQQFVNTMESNEHVLKLNMMSYMHSLYNLMVSCVRLGRIDEFQKHQEKFRAIPIKYDKECSAELKRSIGYYALNLEFFMLLAQKQFRQARERADEIASRTQEGSGLSLLIYLDLCYFLAYTYFGCGEYKLAIRWLNLLLNREQQQIREDLSVCARILQLLCHLELKNEELAHYTLRSTYRYMVKMEGIYRLRACHCAIHAPSITGRCRRFYLPIGKAKRRSGRVRL